MGQASDHDATEPVDGAPARERGGADQSAAVVDPERFARQLRAFVIGMGIFALLATIAAVLAVSVFR